MFATKTILLAVAFCLIGLAHSKSVRQSVAPAPVCPADKYECVLPDCRCSSTEIPEGLKPEEIPQLILLTFDDAIVTTNFPFYQEELAHRKNPNGASISATFFISHEYTDYSMVHQLWLGGHDIALHSITHDVLQDYWLGLDEEGWKKEFVGQKSMMSRFGGIPPADIQGMRAPHLQIGGDTMYKVLHEGGFKWENSRPTLAMRKPGLWPYTNDFESSQDCKIEPCPIGQYKKFWTVPIIDLMSTVETECAMADSCTPVPSTAQETYDLLYKNFNDHYTGNRAPYEISIHAGWVNGTGNSTIEERRKGYSMFLDEMAKKDDVYIVSVARALQWVEDPAKLSNIKTFLPFLDIVRTNRCPREYPCRYGTDPDERYMVSCIPCPRNYPWLENPFGT